MATSAPLQFSISPRALCCVRRSSRRSRRASQDFALSFRAPVRCASTGGRPRVLVNEKLGEAGVELLGKDCEVVETSYGPEDLLREIRNFDGIVIRSGTKVTREVFEAAAGRLRCVGRAGVGVDNVDLQAATEYGCMVCNAPTANTVAAAEHGIALLLSLCRNVTMSDSSMREGKWERSKFVGVSLVGKTIAICGFGKVGAEVAKRAKGLGMATIAYDPYASKEKAAALGVELCDLETALKRADVLSLHMPLTPETDKMFNKELLSKCKPGVRIINVARGGVINDEELAEALDEGIVSAAALDVFAVEPPPEGHPLVGRSDVLVTPHLGASTVEAQEGVALEVAESVVAALTDKPVTTAVNAPLLPKEVIDTMLPYASLAEALGSIAVQMANGGVDSVKITYGVVESNSSTSFDTRLLRANVIKGLIERVSSSFINLVNADYTAKQRGLRITEEIVTVGSSSEGPVSYIRVEVPKTPSKLISGVGADGSISISGKVQGGYPFLCSVGSFETDVNLDGPGVLLCRQVDQPGMIGAVGTKLGAEGCNVSFMTVARDSPRGNALMAIGVDETPSHAALETIKQLTAIDEMLYVDL